MKDNSINSDLSIKVKILSAAQEEDLFHDVTADFYDTLTDITGDYLRRILAKETKKGVKDLR